ncbi:cytochrome c-552 [Geomonas silvestris]|uniref:nitrite reductase (cytochrome; ammonia-forming) n=1 Tax=Geomonas silvestris TaxID=2740184 RepID=A0A6V8MJF5_9BACT|nr:ammonia-forming cytochrome c nitrite reductase subunit c552 [Geomonas silvestris]GFO59933.1 cytochrome c-552 [Geomonas silvestris]
MQRKNLKRCAAVFLVAAAAIWSGCTQHKVEPMKSSEIADGAVDPAEWGKVYPEQYKLWRQTGEPTPAGKSKYKHGYDVGEERRDKLDEYPFLALLYNGWGFGSEYREPRGHYFMVQDQLEVDPGRIKAGGSCLTCKTPYAPMLHKQMGAAYFPTPYKEVLARLPKDQQTLGVACVDCHDNRTMALKISREFTLGRAMKELGFDVKTMDRQQGRNLVCAQCHVTYVIPKDAEMHSTDVYFPWQGSQVGHITIENIIKQIKSSPANGEWKQSVTGFKLGFIRHPEYELFSNESPHWLAGVSCADCHMPTVTENGKKVSDHRIMSPLKSDLKACATCHTESPEALRAKVYTIQDNTMTIYLKAGYATATDAKLFEMANKVEAAGTTIDRSLYAQARENYEQAFYRVVFIGAENSTGFHNPKETFRVLNDATRFAAAAEVQLRQVLAQAGHPAPEKVDLELAKYTNQRGSKKLMFKPEHEIKAPAVQ